MKLLYLLNFPGKKKLEGWYIFHLKSEINIQREYKNISVQYQEVEIKAKQFEASDLNNLKY